MAVALLGIALRVEGDATYPLTEFPVATANGVLGDIKPGRDGNLWFLVFLSGKLGRITPAEEITEFSLPFKSPSQLTTGPDGNLWVTNPYGNSVTVFNTSGVLLHEYPSSTYVGNAYPGGITVGSDGNLWIANGGANTIARLHPDGTGLQECALPSKSGPTYMSAGADGSIWASEDLSHIARVDPNGSVAEFQILSWPAAVFGIVVVADGSAWYAVRDRNKIGHATKDGQLTEYTLPHPNSAPVGIVVGPDGALWFAEAADRIGHMTADGTIDEFSVPAGRGPWDITVGPDGAIWFTERFANMIGRLDPHVFERPRPGSLADVPTLSPWARIFLVVLLGLAGYRLAAS